MIGQNLVFQIRDRVAANLKQQASVMTDDHASLWADYQNHVVQGTSLVESALMNFVMAKVHLELERLPLPILKALWWNTEKGGEALFQASWNHQHDLAMPPKLGNPPDDQIFDDVIELILQSLSELAEREDLEAAQ